MSGGGGWEGAPLWLGDPVFLGLWRGSDAFSFRFSVSQKFCLLLRCICGRKDKNSKSLPFRKKVAFAQCFCFLISAGTRGPRWEGLGGDFRPPWKVGAGPAEGSRPAGSPSPSLGNPSLPPWAWARWPAGARGKPPQGRSVLGVAAPVPPTPSLRSGFPEHYHPLPLCLQGLLSPVPCLLGLNSNPWVRVGLFDPTLCSWAQVDPETV